MNSLQNPNHAHPTAATGATRPTTNAKAEIVELVARALDRLSLPTPSPIAIEHPANSAHGDYSTNVALVIFGNHSLSRNQSSEPLDRPKNPRELAEAIVEQIKTDLSANEAKTAVTEVSVAGPGFINFKLSRQFLLEQMTEIFQDSQKVDTGQMVGTGKKTSTGHQVIVEYSSPNIAKPFTVGHLRSTIIGDAVANLLEAVGYQVERDNHWGDWGTQFGKQIYAIKTWPPYEEGIDQSDHPIQELVQLYVKFHQEAEADPTIIEQGRAWFQKLENGDAEARRLWQKCVIWSQVEFEKIYQRLGIKFTENDGLGYGESFFEEKMAEIVTELEEKGLLTQSEGAKLVFYPDDELPPLMIIKKDGSTLYATRDLATDKFRLSQHGAGTQIVNEVGSEQSLYFRQLFKLEEMLGWVKPGQRVHVGHGLYRFADKKMSTRKGNVIWLEEVLDEAVARAAALGAKKPDSPSGDNDDNSAKIGIGALKWNDLRRSAHLDIVFNWDEILNLTGNSGPYMQYTHVRCQSVLKKAVIGDLAAVDLAVADDVKVSKGLVIEQNTSVESDIAKYIDTLINNKRYFEYDNLNPLEFDILRNLYRYIEVLELSAREYAPHHLCTYLYELAQTYNAFYNQCQILSEKEDRARDFRLVLTAGVAGVIAHGLGILGIQTVERM